MLTAGRSVLRRCTSGDLAVVAGRHKRRFTYELIGGEFGGRGFPEDFEYVGELEDPAKPRGWITAPPGGWGENPVPGRVFDVRWKDGEVWTEQRDEPKLKWPNIIAFRLVEEASPQDQGSSAKEADTQPAPSFQSRVLPWLMECFGAEIAADRVERCDRFIEEALELAQSLDWPRERAIALVDYVYGRPAGEPHQEVGGVMVTLAALCQAAGLDMDAAGEDELARIMRPEIVAKIRAKQAAKPTGSALPVAAARAKEAGE
jgi:hypothetical protein